MWRLGGRVPGLVFILYLLLHDITFFTAIILSAEHVLANVLVFAFFAHCLCGVSHNPEQIKSSILQHRRAFPVSSFGPKPAHFNHFSRGMKCDALRRNLGRRYRVQDRHGLQVHAQLVSLQPAAVTPGTQPSQQQHVSAASDITAEAEAEPVPETLRNIDSSGRSFRGQSFRGQFFSGGRWSSLQCRLLPHTCMRGGIWPFLYNCSLVKHFSNWL